MAELLLSTKTILSSFIAKVPSLMEVLTIHGQNSASVD